MIALNTFMSMRTPTYHRAAHELAARATDAYEDARSKVAHFLNAPSSKEIIFVRGATEAINLVAQSWGRQHINKGDEIVISWIEHHANIVPWQMLAAEKGAVLRVIPVDDSGQILLDEYEKLLSTRTKLVSFTRLERPRHDHARAADWCRWRTATARASSSMAHRRYRTCVWMCRRSMPTSTFSRP